MDAHVVKPAEDKELPEFTEDMRARAVVKKGRHLRCANSCLPISGRLPAEVAARCKATGPGWQTHRAERLAKGPASHAKSEEA